MMIDVILFPNMKFRSWIFHYFAGTMGLLFCGQLEREIVSVVEAVKFYL